MTCMKETESHAAVMLKCLRARPAYYVTCASLITYINLHFSFAGFQTFLYVSPQHGIFYKIAIRSDVLE